VGVFLLNTVYIVDGNRSTSASPMIFSRDMTKIMSSIYIGVTALTFWDHVTSSVR